MTTAERSGASPAGVAHPDADHGQELEARVAARTEELSALNSQFIAALEAERSALAKELHDELGGLITAAKMDTAWLAANAAASLTAAGQEKLASLTQMLNQAMILNRRVVESLRPSLLDHFGLAVALRSHFEEHCKLAGIEFVGTLPEEMTEISAATQLMLFRVAQEALVNIVAAGSARHVELVIEPDGGGYLLTLGDDGEARQEHGMRLQAGMRQRLRSVRGRFESESVPGQGNRIRAYVPRSPTE